MPPRHLHKLPWWLGTHVGQYTALVGPILVVFFQAIAASVLLAVLLIATLLLLTPQVLPTRCACLRQLTERTDGCIGGYEGPWACQHTLLGMPRHTQLRFLPLSTAAASQSLCAQPIPHEGE